MFVSSEAIPIALKNFQSSIEHPLDVDCLCGKDTTFGRHPGNRMFRQKILATLPLFMAARTKTEKMKVTRSIVDFMKRKGSRFLKLKANGSWVQIDTQATRDKVSHALRFAARQHKKQKQEDSHSFVSYTSDERQAQNEQGCLKPFPLTIGQDTSKSSSMPPLCNSMDRQALPNTLESEEVPSIKLFGRFYPIGGIHPLKHDGLPRCESGGFAASSALLMSPLKGTDLDDPFTIDDEAVQNQQLSIDDLAYLVAL